MTISVHFLKYADKERRAICFKNGDKCNIYLYDTKNRRGGIASLIPSITPDLKLDWDGNYGDIVRIDKFNSEDWLESTYAFSICEEDLKSYDYWSQSWINENKPYSIFKGIGRTAKDFIEDSLSFFVKRGIRILSLILPKIETYRINWSNKLKVSFLDMDNVHDWYATMVQASIDTLTEVIYYINDSKSMYYHEYIDGEHRYWLLRNVEIVPIYEKTEIINGQELSQRRDYALNDQQIPVSQTSQISQPLQPLQPSHVFNSSLSSVTTVDSTTSSVTTVTDNSASSGLFLAVFLVAILIIMIVAVLLIFRETGVAVVAPVVAPVAAPVPTVIPLG